MPKVTTLLTFGFSSLLLSVLRRQRTSGNHYFHLTKKCNIHVRFILVNFNISSNQKWLLDVFFYSFRNLKNGTERTLIGGNIQRSDDVKNKPSNEEIRWGEKRVSADRVTIRLVFPLQQTYSELSYFCFFPRFIGSLLSEDRYFTGVATFGIC